MTERIELTHHALSRLQERCEKWHLHFDDGSARVRDTICTGAVSLRTQVPEA